MNTLKIAYSAFLHFKLGCITMFIFFLVTWVKALSKMFLCFDVDRRVNNTTNLTQPVKDKKQLTFVSLGKLECQN